MKKGLALAALVAISSSAMAQIRITEWMYNGDDGEFVEFTNIGNTSIDMTGWSFDDSSRTPGSTDLSSFGVVASGQSVVMSELAASAFATLWGGLAGVSIVGENSHNLGRADEINIYDQSGTLIDQLTYDDATGNGPRTSNVSGNILPASLGQNLAVNAELSSLGDTWGSWTGTNGSIANPGQYTPVPEPATMITLGVGGALALNRRRRKA